jgi:hypothetical protein
MNGTIMNHVWATAVRRDIFPEAREGKTLGNNMVYNTEKNEQAKKGPLLQRLLEKQQAHVTNGQEPLTELKYDGTSCTA